MQTCATTNRDHQHNVPVWTGATAETMLSAEPDRSAHYDGRWDLTKHDCAGLPCASAPIRTIFDRMISNRKLIFGKTNPISTDVSSKLCEGEPNFTVEAQK
jgi:hypothetical protein